MDKSHKTYLFEDGTKNENKFWDLAPFNKVFQCVAFLLYFFFVVDNKGKNKRKANLKMIISMLKSFFQAYRVKVPGTKKEDLPKRSTIEVVKSHLKKGLFLLSEGRVDLDSKDFLDFEVK